MTRALGHERNHADGEDGRRDQLDADRNQPRSIVHCTILDAFVSTTDVVGSIADEVRNHNTERDGELLKSHESAADLRGSLE